MPYATYGPLQAAHQRLRKNEKLLEYLQAAANRLGKPLAKIVLEACVVAYAPEYASERERFKVKPSEEHIHATELVMMNLRGLRTSTDLTLAALVEKACCDWVNANVERLERGLAVFCGEGYIQTRLQAERAAEDAKMAEYYKNLALARKQREREAPAYDLNGALGVIQNQYGEAMMPQLLCELLPLRPDQLPEKFNMITRLEVAFKVLDAFEAGRIPEMPTGQQIAQRCLELHPIAFDVAADPMA